MYLIHVHPLIFDNVINDIAIHFVNDSLIVFMGEIFGLLIFIFFVCVCIDYVRLLLFKKLKIKDLSCRLENVVERLIMKIN